MVEGWTDGDDRIWVAAALALVRYKQRYEFIMEELRTNRKAALFNDQEKQEMASRLMRRLVERS